MKRSDERNSRGNRERRPARPKREKRDRREPLSEKEHFGEREAGENTVLAGRNPVIEALKSGRGVDRILIADGAEGSVRKIAGMARDLGIRVQFVQRQALDRMTGGAVHQGVAAVIEEFPYCDLEDILQRARERREDAFIIVLDGIEDPHNLGAILRTADAAGAHGVVIPVNRAASVTAVAEKAAAGAASYVPVARVTNIAQTIEVLKEENIWTVAVDMDGDNYWKAPLTGPVAMVIGNEGRGISRLVKKKCDFSVSVPMYGGVNSLNASNAAALLMYEIRRQRVAQE